MSELLDALHKAGDKVIDGKAPELIADLLVDGEALAEKHLTGDLEPLRGPALDAIEVLKDDKVVSAVASLTKAGFARVIGLFESGDKHGARRVYMATEATAQERIDFQNASGDAAVLLFDKRAREWEALVEAFTRIGKIALKALGAVVLGLIGVKL
ncbi:hypothetical protein LCGC14_0274150 [marine sediment metagenome]|uniref:Uncharacterized protein n=2 Tax=root TaxID=1 RepID=A0A9C9NEJ5_9HYPH|nr:hypothetical protein [Aurantimonas coralicida]